LNTRSQFSGRGHSTGRRLWHSGRSHSAGAKLAVIGSNSFLMLKNLVAQLALVLITRSKQCSAHFHAAIRTTIFHGDLVDALNVFVFLTHSPKLHVCYFSLTLPALNLLNLRVLSQRVPWTELGLAKTHCNVGVDKCHD
jgi:hypothetical protein